VVFGLLLALVTGVLASWAGQRARADGRSMDNATIALGLAVLDGVVWLVLHFVFDLSFVAG
jgi:membrane glycosyltransferase